MKFYIEEKINFSISGSYDETIVDIYSLDINNNPEFSGRF